MAIKTAGQKPVAKTDRKGCTVARKKHLFFKESMKKIN